jgi:hypothetical protein
MSACRRVPDPETRTTTEPAKGSEGAAVTVLEPSEERRRP